MRKFLLCYGPPRGERISDALGPDLRAMFEACFMVSYTYDPADFSDGFLGGRIEDPGVYAVQERVGQELNESTSNSRRQFVQIRHGIKMMLDHGVRPDDLVLLLRSDLALADARRLKDFVGERGQDLGMGHCREVRLTTNSINPFSFTGHGLHASDWVIFCRFDRLVEKMSVDPETYAAGTYTRWEMTRKGRFCYGALAAEELFSIAHYAQGQALSEGLNSMRITLQDKLRFLGETRFVSPGTAGVTLKKWEYLHRFGWVPNHPFGSHPFAYFKWLTVWATFSGELMPASGAGFWPRLAMKTIASWVLQIPRTLLLALRPAAKP